MTRSELVDALAHRHSVPRVVAERAVEGFFSGIAEALRAGARVEVRGFGSFAPRRYQGYVGRNPRTGETVEVLPKVLPVFKVGKELKSRIEGPE
jgi:integration host factor subunit beta